MKAIETGVDKLVKLIEQKKRISLEDAAKELGVSTVLVQEWADFLEEDGLISIEYSLSKVWLNERQLSEKEAKKKEKEYAHKRDSYTRKVETALKVLDKQTLGFEKMKDEFYGLKKDIGGEIDYVKKELKELEYYQDLKNNIDKDIEKQKVEYQKLMDESHLQIKTEEKRFQSMIAQVGRERQKVAKEKKTVQDLEEKEEMLLKQVESMNELVGRIRTKIKDENKDLSISEANVDKLERFVEQVDKRMKNKKHDVIIPLIKASENHRSRVVNLQEQILEKLKQKKQELDEYKGQSKKIYQKLKKFFSRKADAEKLFNQIEKDKQNLKKEFDHLIKKSQAFNAISKSSDVVKHMITLEKEYKEIEKKRSSLSEEIQKLTTLIKG